MTPLSLIEFFDIKSGITIWLSLLFAISTSGQKLFLIAEKMASEKKLELKDGARVKIKTKDGKKHIGKLVILDEDLVAIKGNIVNISEIAQIKKKSVIGAIGGLFVMAYSGLIGAVGTAYAINENDTELILASASFTALGVGLGIFMNDTPPNHHHDAWNYRIIRLEN